MSKTTTTNHFLKGSSPFPPPPHRDLKPRKLTPPPEVNQQQGKGGESVSCRNSQTAWSHPAKDCGGDQLLRGEQTGRKGARQAGQESRGGRPRGERNPRPEPAQGPDEAAADFRVQGRRPCRSAPPPPEVGQQYRRRISREENPRCDCHMKTQAVARTHTQEKTENHTEKM